MIPAIHPYPGSTPVVRVEALLFLFGLLAACDSPTVPIDVPTAPVPLALERVSPVVDTAGPDAWVGLTVRVTRLYSRLPIPGVPVRWQATTADAELAASPDFIPAKGPLTRGTDPGGLATVFVRQKEVGTTNITASLSGSDTGTVTFTVTTRIPTEYVISFGPLFDCNEVSSFSHDGSSAENVSVPVGTVVEWVYDPWLHPVCTARIQSVSIPPGATGFDSGLMSPAQRFRFVFQVAGTWRYIDAVNGGSGTITVTTP